MGRGDQSYTGKDKMTSGKQPTPPADHDRMTSPGSSSEEETTIVMRRTAPPGSTTPYPGAVGMNDDTIPGVLTPPAGYLSAHQPGPPPAVVRSPVPTIPNPPSVAPRGYRGGQGRTSVPMFGGGLRGRFLRATGLGGVLPQTSRWLDDRTRTRLRWRFLLTLVLVALLLTGALGAVDAGVRLARARAEASDGLRHLRTLEKLIPTSKTALASSLTSATVTRIQSELVAAEHDFADLRGDLE